MFKVGDKIRAKNGMVPGTLEVVLVNEKDQFLVRNADGVWTLITYPMAWELVPDPMVARREAYIAWASLAWPSGANGYPAHFHLVREGKQEETVNRYYDAFVATKHLFV